MTPDRAVIVIIACAVLHDIAVLGRESLAAVDEEAELPLVPPNHPVEDSNAKLHYTHPFWALVLSCYGSVKELTILSNVTRSHKLFL